MKGYAALIEPSELDWSEAKLGCYGRDSCTGIDVVAWDTISVGGRIEAGHEVKRGAVPTPPEQHRDFSCF